MPFSNLKIAFAFLATLILFLGFAGVVSSDKPKALLAQSGFGKGLEQPAVQPLDRQAPATSKFAVVIGIVYDNFELGDVHYADRDANSVYDLLTTKYGFPKENVVLLTNANANRQNILAALDWLAHNPDIDSGSDVVFFYSGHGLRSAPDVGLNLPGGQTAYALVPFDFMKYDFKKGQGLLWDSELKGYLKDIHPGRMWINIDSCSSGGFNQPGITGPNRVVTMSSQGDELSGEIPETQRGVMMQYMVEDGMSRGLSVEQAFAAASPRAALGYSQNPQIADDYPGNMDLGNSPQIPTN